jgi:two-component system C4-dicarboxylate transport response regulator DctD
VLQERQVERLGLNAPVAVDLRVVAASKEDLRQLADEGRFRADLYYRLNIAVIDLPPLRERREDIPLLFEHFLLQAGARYEREPPQVDAALRRALSAYDWPGNVRELRNIADRYVLGILGAPFLAGAGVPAKASLSLQEELAVVERTRIEHELRLAAGDTAAAAAALGIPRTTLYDKLKRHGLSAERFR